MNTYELDLIDGRVGFGLKAKKGQQEVATVSCQEKTARMKTKTKREQFLLQFFT